MLNRWKSRLINKKNKIKKLNFVIITIIKNYNTYFAWYSIFAFSWVYCKMT